MVNYWWIIIEFHGIVTLLISFRLSPALVSAAWMGSTKLGRSWVMSMSSLARETLEFMSTPSCSDSTKQWAVFKVDRMCLQSSAAAFILDMDLRLSLGSNFHLLRANDETKSNHGNFEKFQNCHRMEMWWMKEVSYFWNSSAKKFAISVVNLSPPSFLCSEHTMWYMPPRTSTILTSRVDPPHLYTMHVLPKK